MSVIERPFGPGKFILRWAAMKARSTDSYVTHGTSLLRQHTIIKSNAIVLCYDDFNQIHWRFYHTLSLLNDILISLNGHRSIVLELIYVRFTFTFFPAVQVESNPRTLIIICCIALFVGKFDKMLN